MTSCHHLSLLRNHPSKAIVAHVLWAQEPPAQSTMRVRLAIVHHAQENAWNSCAQRNSCLDNQEGLGVVQYLAS